ncbi:hypothetical protein T230_14465 [Tannerella sp. oral taxon BU063 isolate Cell 1/3]|uniref:Lipocalin-like domain-containing protein n=1 Tax=Tannerella sp. oral taxon BU063 isolate Cell 1/3 TaxID=1411022 RepID=W2CHT9_9BACT|nr:hypothetical protein T230_14465 [Tannerella sp. oral taxon BU063 isolate Cell 1/3]
MFSSEGVGAYCIRPIRRPRQGDECGYVDIEGYKLFGSIPEDQLSYGYRPWGKENTLFIGWTYFTYNLEGETLTMSNGVDIDGPRYVFKRLRK